ncbi:hypothetical protein ACIQM0_39280 [Streptomyces sp. NPDC091387]|uniref:hypothetical protein n=1 Tax=Streptomyces sp. NPDC091387 TaxID=3365998 RepID=UPI00382583A9
MLAFDDAGGFGFLDFCSLACAQFTESALKVAKADYSPAIEHRAHMLDVLSTMLDARSEPLDLTGGEHGRR